MLKARLEGLKVSLEDDTQVEDFSFHGDKVIAIIGTRDGELCAPILEMNVLDFDTLEIKGQGVITRWQKIRITGNEVQVIRNGQQSVYRITGKHHKKVKARLEEQI